MPLKNNKYIGYDNDAVSSLNNFVTADHHFIYKNIKCIKLITIQDIAAYVRYKKAFSNIVLFSIN